MDGLATGVDLVEVERLVELQDRIRQRFIERVYTPVEIMWADGSNGRLAEIFAAKEAVAKTLGSGIGDVSWQDIEIILQDAEAPAVCLSNKAKEIAEDLGLRRWWLSTSHTSRYALAFVVAATA